jgi:hypothetical protein
MELGADNLISREEAAVWMVRALGVYVENIMTDVYDSNFVLHREAVRTAINLGLINVMPGNLFQPTMPLSEADGAGSIVAMSGVFESLTPGDIDDVFYYVFRSDVTVISQVPVNDFAETDGIFVITTLGANPEISGLFPGDVFVLKPTDNLPSGFAGRVTSVVYENGEYIITASAPESLDEIYYEFEFSGTFDLLEHDFDIVIPDWDYYGISAFSVNPMSSGFRPNIRRTNNYVAISIRDAFWRGITIDLCELRLLRPRAAVRFCMQSNHADIYIIAEAELELDVSANFAFDTVIPLFTIPIKLDGIGMVKVEIPVGIRITAEGDFQLEINSNLRADFGIINGIPSARHEFTHDVVYSYYLRASISLNIQGKLKVAGMDVYGIQGDFGRGFRIGSQLRHLCPWHTCFVVEIFDVRRVRSLTSGLLGGIPLLQFNKDFARFSFPTHWFFAYGERHINRCPHGGIGGLTRPGSQPSGLTPDVVVSNELQLMTAIGQAGSEPRVIALLPPMQGERNNRYDFNLISGITIPSGSDITLISYGVYMFGIVATRNINVIIIEQGASLTIENVWITRDPSTTGRGVVVNGNFTLNSGEISGHRLTSGDSSGVQVGSTGRFIMNGGSINNNLVSSLGRGGGVGNFGVFEMYGGTITGNAIEGVFVPNTGIFTMFNGVISGNDGTGVSTRNSGRFILENGTVSANTASGVFSNATFEMNGGLIVGNEGSGGGGVRGGSGHANVRITINGGTIAYNHASTNGGGLATAGATVTLNGGVIRNNTAPQGGGVAVNSGILIMGGLTINGGYIIDNTALGGNGGGIISGNQLTINGGIISGNTAHFGGGLYSTNENRSTVTMTGGYIINNAATVGGGIRNRTGFSFSDGVIRGNSADTGAGIYNNGNLTMTGGIIHGNTASVASGGLRNLGTFTFNGGWIFGNVAPDPNNRNYNNFYTAQAATFNWNVWDINYGSLELPPPGFIASFAMPMSATAPVQVVATLGSNAPAGYADIILMLENNEGVNALSLQMGYDNTVMEKVSATSFGSMRLPVSPPAFARPFVLNFESESPVNPMTQTGILGLVRFRILDSAAQTSPPITLNLVSAYNVDNFIPNGVSATVFVDFLSGTATIPDAPTNANAIAGTNQATVSFSAPANDGGSPITGFTVTSNPSGITATGTQSPIIVTGLASGTTYTFTVTATNSVGTGLPSIPSNPITTPATTSQFDVQIMGGGVGHTASPGLVAVGTPVTINAGTREGYTFYEWDADGIVLANPSESEVTFYMPANNIILTAIWTRQIIDSFQIILDDGGIGSFAPSLAIPANRVNIYAGIRDGFTFSHWTAQELVGAASLSTPMEGLGFGVTTPAALEFVLPFNEITFGDRYSDDTYFYMPNFPVRIIAHWLPLGIEPRLTVSNTTVAAGQEATVQIRIANNPGFAAMPLRISFPNELSLVRYDVPAALRSGFTGPVDTAQGQRIAGGLSSPVYMNWARISNYTNDGILLTLTFAIAAGATPGNYDISVSFRDIYGYCSPMNNRADIFEVIASGGHIRVLERSLGDVSGNGGLDLFDATLIARHLAGHPDLHLLPGVAGFNISYGIVTPGSVDRGSVRLIDAIMIARYLAGHPGIVLGEYPMD